MQLQSNIWELFSDFIFIRSILMIIMSCSFIALYLRELRNFVVKVFFFEELSKKFQNPTLTTLTLTLKKTRKT